VLSALGGDEVEAVEDALVLSAGLVEEGAVEEDVVLRLPHPVLVVAVVLGLPLGDLLVPDVVEGPEPVALADDGGVHVAADGVHAPVRVVVVDDVEEAVAAARHPLHEVFAEVVEGDGDLHDLVLGEAVAAAEEHDVVVLGEVAVGDGDGGGAVGDVDEAVLAVEHGDVVDPDVAGAHDGDAVAVAGGAEAEVVVGVADLAAEVGDGVVDVEVVDDDVAHVLHGDLRARDVHLRAAAVDGLVAVDDELVAEVDNHVAREHDPEGPVLDHGVPERALPRGHHVEDVVGGVGHHVELAVVPAPGAVAEPHGALGQLLAVLGPVVVATPALVDRVRRHARALVLVTQRPPRLARRRRPVINAPACRHYIALMHLRSIIQYYTLQFKNMIRSRLINYFSTSLLKRFMVSMGSLTKAPRL
jgi:hypothetical protein